MKLQVDYLNNKKILSDQDIARMNVTDAKRYRYIHFSNDIRFNDIPINSSNSTVHVPTNVFDKGMLSWLSLVQAMVTDYTWFSNFLYWHWVDIICFQNPHHIERSGLNVLNSRITHHFATPPPPPKKKQKQKLRLVLWQGNFLFGLLKIKMVLSFRKYYYFVFQSI